VQLFGQHSQQAIR